MRTERQSKVQTDRHPLPLSSFVTKKQIHIITLVLRTMLLMFPYRFLAFDHESVALPLTISVPLVAGNTLISLISITTGYLRGLFWHWTDGG